MFPSSGYVLKLYKIIPQKAKFENAKDKLTLEEKIVILNFYVNTTKEISMRKIAMNQKSKPVLSFLSNDFSLDISIQKVFIKSVSKLCVSTQYYTHCVFL